MCYYRLYIFMGCGHSALSKTPVRYCKDASSHAYSHDTGYNTDGTLARESHDNFPSTPRVKKHMDTVGLDKEHRLHHPFHTIRLEHLCVGCARDREDRLRVLSLGMTTVRFDVEKRLYRYQGASKVASERQDWGGGGMVGGWMGGWSMKVGTAGLNK
ncbi:uncharacterized protein SETTUDRAFT_38329 [Exserohilum turcica Et28A]|uniref:Uncharacterized protein n=1 Tax=Exserohilum turcicum (strain 28A) TaxID=671987 RepID=R0IWP6_EXST2|nr:uncharacterized protein SETTUDRAFT_38329 [Exserohilum turcica Et28A]EOA89021.1 hypothetical protein SETTUDRAFT_38329 [Exserohilum turcica Et28A]